jgi:hypothetical protein
MFLFQIDFPFKICENAHLSTTLLRNTDLDKYINTVSNLWVM